MSVRKQVIFLNKEQVKNEILSLTYDVQFGYNGVDGLVMPYSRNSFDVCYKDVEKHYDDIDELMNDKIFDGKSLNEISEYIEIY